jgi:hypothetical protein
VNKVTRPRHSRPELEAVLAEAERKGWRVNRGKKYYMMLCPCGHHMKTVKLTPSGRDYKRNLVKQLIRATCWDGAPKP